MPDDRSQGPPEVVRYLTGHLAHRRESRLPLIKSFLHLTRTQLSLDPRLQFRHLERLGHIVDCANLEP